MQHPPNRPANLAALLFGAYRRGVLALLLLHPEQSLHVREIARLMQKAPGTLLRELNALTDAGILLRRIVGHQAHYQANAECPIYDELRSILKKTIGIADVLREALAQLAEHIRVAFIYGSIARGDERAGSDIDLLIVGETDFASVVTALAPAQQALRREVNPNVYPALEFRRKLAAREPFLERVIAEKKIFVIGGEHDLAKPVASGKTQGTRRRRARDRAAPRIG